jgi:hypothetical protein
MNWVAKTGVGAVKEGGSMCFETYVGTGVNKAKSGWSGRKGDVVCRGGAILKGGVINIRGVAGGGGRIGVVCMKVCVHHDAELKLLIGRE